MALELKELIEFLGYKPEDVKELSDLKTKFDAEFIRSSNINEDSEPVKKILGKVFGTLENDIKKASKGFELDVDFDNVDFQKANPKVSDKFKFVIAEYDKKNKLVLADLTAKAGLGNDDKVKELQLKYDKVSQKSKDYESLLGATKTEFDLYKTTTASEIKNKTLSIHKKEVFDKAKFLPDTNEYTKKGFLDSFQEKYKADLDENEKLVVFDVTGKRINSTKITGTFKTLEEVLEEELVKAKLSPLNQDGGKAKPTFVQQQQQVPVGKVQRTVAQRMG